jgi:large conductance mechanosensitive channel
MFKEFKEFALRGNVLDMAVGIIIGGAFGTIVKSLLGGVDFTDLFMTLKPGSPAGPYATLAAAQEAGAVTVNLGLFVNSLISFLIVAWAVFLLIRGYNAAARRFEEEKTPPPSAPTREVVLLEEIRDLLQAR